MTRLPNLLKALTAFKKQPFSGKPIAALIAMVSFFFCVLLVIYPFGALGLLIVACLLVLFVLD